MHEKMTRTAKKGGSYLVGKDGKVTLLHRTYASEAERKAEVSNSKKEKDNAVKT